MKFYSLIYLLLSLTITQIDASAPGPNERAAAAATIKSSTPITAQAPATDHNIASANSNHRYHELMCEEKDDWKPLHWAVMSRKPSSLGDMQTLLKRGDNPLELCTTSIRLLCNGCLKEHSTPSELPCEHEKWMRYSAYGLAKMKLRDYKRENEFTKKNLPNSTILPPSGHKQLMDDIEGAYLMYLFAKMKHEESGHIEKFSLPVRVPDPSLSELISLFNDKIKLMQNYMRQKTITPQTSNAKTHLKNVVKD